MINHRVEITHIQYRILVSLNSTHILRFYLANTLAIGLVLIIKLHSGAKLHIQVLQKQ